MYYYHKYKCMLYYPHIGYDRNLPKPSYHVETTIFSTPKTGIALPAISARSDNMLANIVYSEIDVIN